MKDRRPIFKKWTQPRQDFPSPARVCKTAVPDKQQKGTRFLKTIIPSKKATKEGMPYQTLISSTLHKFVTGKLKSVEQEIAKADIKAARRILRRKGGQPPEPEDLLP